MIRKAISRIFYTVRLTPVDWLFMLRSSLPHRSQWNSSRPISGGREPKCFGKDVIVPKRDKKPPRMDECPEEIT
jgi:hypothetical protein